MYIIACRYLKDRNQAEEVMQDGFVKAFKNLDQFKGEVSFGAWLKKIIINKCLDVLKKNELNTVSIHEQNFEVLDDENWEVSNKVSISIVKECIDQIPMKYSVVLKLYLIDGYDHQEISDILGVLESTSRSLLFRGKKLVKTQLKNLDYGTRS